MTEKLPKDLEGKRKRKDRSLIAKYKCESETKGSLYWRKVEDRSCRVHGKGEEGRGLETMKRIDKEGSGREKENKEEGEY
ncbi:hypothetical protein ALC53_03089 [Atta colombica]|uniref:Uncharacterized protein n=1 Tax=Atta colombica TaxID=520822 RepID=A0A195BQ21_9HYME|nr:hypothetical protein ALC53_03089 [Atta colombica]